MAILKMKKLTLTVITSQKEELLKRLIKLGCVEFNEQEELLADRERAESLSRVDSSLVTLRTEHSVLSNALSLVNRYAPEKSPLLAAKPEFAGDDLLSPTGVEKATAIARDILSADEKVRKIGTEESRQRALMEALEHWEPLDFRLESEGTERASVTLGTVALRESPEKLETALSETAPEAELFTVSEDSSRRYLALVSLKEQTADALEALRGAGFTPVQFTGLNGTPKDCINLAKGTLNSLADEKGECFDRISDGASHRKELQLAADKLEARIAMAEAEEKLVATESTVTMQGWVPEENLPELEKCLSDFVCMWDTEDPAEEEYPSVPVKLKNNKITNSLNMVTNMYSLPRYGTVDPNPLMAPFFIIFYGLMMADMGYGVIMVVAALVAMKKMKPREGTLAFCQLLLWCGISTFVMGALTGGLFSDIPYQLVHIFHPESTWEGLPYLFSPVYQSETVLYGSLALGALHLNAGMVVSFVQKVKAGEVKSAVWEEGTLWLVLVGGILAVLKIGTVGKLPIPLVIAVILLLFGAGREAKGFGKVTAAFSCIYNTATGWFGDVLSYSRIMALMLAGGVVGQVFNTVAVMPMQNSGVNVGTFLAFLVIFLLGHAMNFGLNLLGCYVHDLRLQCLEFFGKFYVDGGKPFTPLKFGGKYFRAKEN